MFYFKLIRRNKLAQPCLNDLVFVKYNRTLKDQYNLCDQIDPITFIDIDDSNDSLVGMLDRDFDSDRDPEFDDDDSLTRMRLQGPLEPWKVAMLLEYVHL